MPKKIRDEYKDRCRRLWFDAHGADPERSIENIYHHVLFEEFEGRVHRFRADPGESWPEKQRPSLSWFTKRIRDTWPQEAVAEQSVDKVAMSWGSYWGNDPARVRILSVLSDLASEVLEGVEEYPFDGVPDFQGFTESVCDWAYKLSAFFDLENRHQCLLLINFAYIFSNDERYGKAFGVPMSIQSEASKMLMRWHKRHREPDLTAKTLEKTTWNSTPFWDDDEWEGLELVVSRHLAPAIIGWEIGSIIDDVIQKGIDDRMQMDTYGDE